MLVGLANNWLCRYVFTAQIAVPILRHMAGSMLGSSAEQIVNINAYLIIFVVYCCLNILNHNQCQVIVEVNG